MTRSIGIAFSLEVAVLLRRDLALARVLANIPVISTRLLEYSFGFVIPASRYELLAVPPAAGAFVPPVPTAVEVDPETVALDRIHPLVFVVERLADALCVAPLSCVTHPVTVRGSAAFAERLDDVAVREVPRRDVSA